jgi:phenylpropionate dioxygenase-like ring-hydroxylating dioxygenase large terminal subunit
MGPPDQQPPFPAYDTFSRPDYRVIPGQKYFYPCNWLQIMENVMNPAHAAFLRTHQWCSLYRRIRDPAGAGLHRDPRGMLTP